jgi:formylglycine-generating enzyme required for sulfatase activity
MGAQDDDANGLGFDPLARPNEGPVHEVVLDAYYLSKYELTNAQWYRLDPTVREHQIFRENKDATPLHPMESVTWLEISEIMRQLGLVLPSEAQWEFACRAGTETPYSCGSPGRDLDAANIADETFFAAFPENRIHPEGSNSVDGAIYHAPVGSYPPNPFGFHDMHGNVRELCRDQCTDDYRYTTNAPRTDGQFRMAARGGGYRDDRVEARSSARSPQLSGDHFPDVGFRPAMELAP